MKRSHETSRSRVRRMRNRLSAPSYPVPETQPPLLLPLTPSHHQTWLPRLGTCPAAPAVLGWRWQSSLRCVQGKALGRRSAGQQQWGCVGGAGSRPRSASTELELAGAAGGRWRRLYPIRSTCVQAWGLTCSLRGLQDAAAGPQHQAPGGGQAHGGSHSLEPLSADSPARCCSARDGGRRRGKPRPWDLPHGLLTPCTEFAALS